MGHCLEAVIGLSDLLLEFADRWVHAQPVQLPQDFVLIPMIKPLIEDIDELAGQDYAVAFGEFYLLSKSVTQAIAEISYRGGIAYIETDFFGGVGTQSAVVWEKGQVVLGPERSEVSWSGQDFVAPPLHEMAINQALRYLGVWTKDSKDEFAMLGLDKFRATDRVAAKAR